MTAAPVLAPRERPILFSAPMVRAILDGRKTVTRRHQCDYRVGDLLYVRETWQVITGKEPGDLGACVRYRDGWVNACWMPAEKPLPLGLTWDHWRPSIHMPKWAARIWLEVVSVRKERLQDITEEGARAEGLWRAFETRAAFAALWDEIHGEGAWASNPEIRAIEFRRVK